MSDSFIFGKKVLSSEQCKSIIDFYHSSIIHQHPGFSGAECRVNEHIKMSTDLNCELDPDLQKYEDSDIIDTIRDGLFKTVSEYVWNRYPFLDQYVNSWMVDSSFNIQCYYPGQGYYGLHCENASKNNDRFLAWMIYLNDVDDGGGTEFTNQKIRLKAREGVCYVWPAGWTHMHRGIVSKTQTKYIATGWYSYTV